MTIRLRYLVTALVGDLDPHEELLRESLRAWELDGHPSSVDITKGRTRVAVATTGTILEIDGMRCPEVRCKIIDRTANVTLAKFIGLIVREERGGVRPAWHPLHTDIGTIPIFSED